MTTSDGGRTSLPSPTPLSSSSSSYSSPSSSLPLSLSSSLCSLGVFTAVHPQKDWHRRRQRTILGEGLVRKRAFGWNNDDDTHPSNYCNRRSSGPSSSTSSTNPTTNNNSNRGTTGTNRHQQHHQQQPNQQPEVVYRKKECPSSSNHAYTHCTFLDQYDKVMAIDCNGTLDVFQLSDLRRPPPPCNDKGDHQNHHQQHQQQLRRRKILHPPHKEIVTNLELGCLIPCNDFSTVHIQSLAGGTVVAMGMSDDSLCIVDLESSSSSSQQQQNGRINNCTTSDCRRRRALVNNNIESIQQDPSILSSLPISRIIKPNIQHIRGWRTEQPKRKYYRDRTNPLLTLHEMARTQTQRQQHQHHHDHNYLSELQEIGVNGGSTTPGSSRRIPNQVRFVCHVRPSNRSRWDVREVHEGCTSLLQIAHVDSDYDAFWMQLLDGRVNSNNNNNNGSSSSSSSQYGSSSGGTSSGDSTINPTRRTTVGRPGRNNNNQRPMIFIDGTSKDKPGTREEHVVACTMVSDICLATAHIGCSNYGLTPARDFFDRDLPYSGLTLTTCIKLWDIRMVSSSFSSSPTSHRRPQEPHTIVPLPSFPQSDCILLDPCECIETRLSQNGSLAFQNTTTTTTTVDGDLSTHPGTGVVSKYNHTSSSSSPWRQDGGNDCVITALSSFRGGGNNGRSNGGGSLLVTVQSRTKSSQIEHHLFDLGRMEVTRKVCQSNQNLGCHPVYAIADSHETMVCYSKGGCTVGGAPTSSSSSSSSCGGVAIYDLSTHNRPSSSSYPSTSSYPSVGKKRFLEGNGRGMTGLPTYQQPNHWSPQRQRKQQNEQQCVYQFHTKLEDRYGLETELSCIAMNSNGTSMVGGTPDGDIFVWRGI